MNSDEKEANSITACPTTGVPTRFCACLQCNRPAEPEQESDPHNVECMDCHHVWVGFYLPQPIDTATKIMGSLRCPKCGAGAKRICIAQEDVN